MGHRAAAHPRQRAEETDAGVADATAIVKRSTRKLPAMLAAQEHKRISTFEHVVRPVEASWNALVANIPSELKAIESTIREYHADITYHLREVRKDLAAHPEQRQLALNAMWLARLITSGYWIINLDHLRRARTRRQRVNRENSKKSVVKRRQKFADRDVDVLRIAEEIRNPARSERQRAHQISRKPSVSLSSEQVRG